MDSNLKSIKALAKSLVSDLDSLKRNGETKDEIFNLNEKIREFEIEIIKAALIETAGNRRRAAHLLGLKATTLHYKIKTYDIKLKISAKAF